jgi:outer membrane protein TolC
LNGPADGILLTRIRFDQSRAEFERVINTMMLNVEVAYWNLYGAYWNLYSREQALRQAYEAWKINKLRYEAGREDIANLAQARGQFELFRDQRISALNQVLESERNLRSLLGMPAGDDFRFVPIDTPTLAPYQPDWTTALNDALALRPELMIAREELKARQLDVIWIKNLLLPDLRVFATYDINGIGNRLDGPEADNAFRSLASNHFNSWQIGTRLEFPLGYRDAHAQTRVARLQLARSYYALRDQERKAEQNLAFAYRQLAQLHLRIQALRAQRQAFGEQLHARFQAYSVGKTGLDILLEAQRFWADALANEFNVIAQYNSALAGFEFARGTLLQHNNVIVSEGQLPKCAQKRAVEHENQKAASLVLGERALPHTAYGEDGCGLPKLGPDDAPSLPSLLKGAPPVPKEQPEPLPPPSKVMPPAKTQGEGPDKGPALPTGAVPAGSLAPSTTSAPRLRGDGR